MLTSSLGGSTLSTPVASDEPHPPKWEAEKPLAVHIEYDEQKARTPVSCEIGRPERGIISVFSRWSFRAGQQVTGEAGKKRPYLLSSPSSHSEPLVPDLMAILEVSCSLWLTELLLLSTFHPDPFPACA